MKALSRDRMIELFQQLQEGDLLTCNTVGNLAVIRDGSYVGFVDLAGEGYIELLDAELET
jgi:hypothetical protein